MTDKEKLHRVYHHIGLTLFAYCYDSMETKIQGELEAIMAFIDGDTVELDDAKIQNDLSDRLTPPVE